MYYSLLTSLRFIFSFFQFLAELYEWCYSHHQKCVIVDAQTPNSDDLQKPRHIAAFLGGLDIARGRYDTPEHPLFSTLKAEHAGDFYQKCVNVSSEVGPRQPWHDIHCMVSLMMTSSAWYVL